MARDRESSPAAEDTDFKPGMPGSGPDRDWWRPPAWSRSPLLHEWIRSGGILIAAAWGVYTFVYKDILVPSWQPANINLEASFTPVPDRPATADGREMTLVVKVVNTSSRRVYPLANIWWLTGLKRDPRPAATAQADQSFLQEADPALRQRALQHVERGVIRTPGSLLAVGRLFDDDVIDPGGVVNRTLLVRIPNRYNAVDLRVVVPLLTRPSDGLFHGRELAWGLSPSGDPRLLLCPAEDQDQSGKPSGCLAANEAEIDRTLQQFDAKTATISLTQEIGLPLAASRTAAALAGIP
jgi:hypothetical protein